MIIENSIYLAMEFVGTIAFACSGSMIAMQRRLDYLGVVVLGITTAVGGGILRDIIIGQIPPSLFLNPSNAIIAFWINTCLFITVKMRWSHYLHLQSKEYDDIMNLSDALGLGIFTATGINTAITAGFGSYTLFCVFLGVITGVGGGILRDILLGQTPIVLRKHVYACASIAGAVTYINLLPIANRDTSMLLSSLVVLVIRILARKYNWNLPVANSEDLG